MTITWGGCRAPTAARRAFSSPTRRARSSPPTASPSRQSCGFEDPDHSWDGGRTELDGGRMDGFLRAASDVVLDRVLRGGRRPLHPARGQGVHHLRPLLLLAAGPHLPQSRVHARRPVLRDDRQHAAGELQGPRVPGHHDLQRAQQGGRLQPLLLHRPAALGPVGRAGPGRARARSRSTTSAPPPAPCRRCPSWTRPFRARARAPAATSTRWPTSASARPSSPMSCTPS